MLVGCGLAACGGPEAERQTAEPAADVAPAPPADPGELSPAERDLLARAKGRTWEDLSVEGVAAYLAPTADTTSALFLWDPATGQARLREFGEAVKGLREVGVRVAVAVRTGGDEREELIDLRASQVVMPAYRIPADRRYPFVLGGLPAGNSLIVSPAGGEGAAPFSPSTPVQAYRPLLEAQAPRSAQ